MLATRKGLKHQSDDSLFTALVANWLPTSRSRATHLKPPSPHSHFCDSPTSGRSSFSYSKSFAHGSNKSFGPYGHYKGMHPISILFYVNGGHIHHNGRYHSHAILCLGRIKLLSYLGLFHQLYPLIFHGLLTLGLLVTWLLNLSICSFILNMMVWMG